MAVQVIGVPAERVNVTVLMPLPMPKEERGIVLPYSRSWKVLVREAAFAPNCVRHQVALQPEPACTTQVKVVLN